jgi:hypothetical protein
MALGNLDGNAVDEVHILAFFPDGEANVLEF